MSSLGDEDVCGLDVAMNNAVAMGRIERIRDLEGQRKHAISLERLSGNQLPQGDALEEFHGDESPACFLSDVVNGADVGLIQCRGGLGFALKTRQTLGIMCRVRRKKFQRHKTMQAGIFRFVHHTHSAATKFLNDAIMGDLAAFHVASLVGRGC